MNEQQIIESIISELSQPQNRDLLVEMIRLGDKDASQSFMWGFASPHRHEALGFEDYADMLRNIESQFKEQGFDIGDTVNMSKAYDDYLAHLTNSQATSPIDKTQASRFDAIVEKHNNDGWSGAYYGFLCRKVQATLKQMYASQN